MILAKRGEAGARWQALTALHVAAVIFGSVALFGKIDASPAWIVAGRTLIAALVLAPVVIALRIPLTGGLPRLGILAATAALLAVHWITFFASVQMAGVAIGALTVSTFPLFTILIQAGMARRWPRRLEWIAGIMIIAASALIAGPGLPDAPYALAGALVGLLSALLFAIFALASQNLMRELPASLVALYQNALVALMLAPVLPFTQGFGGAADIWAIVALGVVGTALSHQLYLFALNRLPAAACGAVASLEPVYAVIFAAALFAEPIQLSVAFSAVLIVGASLMLLRRRPAEIASTPPT
jgi:drug/metabolite transporter (DMT)-like permease